MNLELVWIFDLQYEMTLLVIYAMTICKYVFAFTFLKVSRVQGFFQMMHIFFEKIHQLQLCGKIIYEFIFYKGKSYKQRGLSK